MKPTLAIIPGSFRPPHAGHWDMISHYASKVDYAVVIVSAPAVSVRRTSEGAGISSWKSKDILDVIIARSGLENVRVRVSDRPSPVKAMLDAIDSLSNCKIIVGCSDKDGPRKYAWIQSGPR